MQIKFQFNIIFFFYSRKKIYKNTYTVDFIYRIKDKRLSSASKFKKKINKNKKLNVIRREIRLL